MRRIALRVEPAAERVLILSYSLVIADVETECDDDADRVRRQRGELRRERGRERREVRALVSCKAAGTEHAADVRVAYVGGGVDGGAKPPLAKLLANYLRHVLGDKLQKAQRRT